VWARASSLALFFTSGRMWKFRFLGGAALQRCIKTVAVWLQPLRCLRGTSHRFVHPGSLLTIALAGGLSGAVAGVLQHLSIRQASDGFLTASSLMEVRRASTSNPRGRKHI
jgi:hypothetical protein